MEYRINLTEDTVEKLGTALGEPIQELEQEILDKEQEIAEQSATIAEQGETIEAQEGTIAEQAETIEQQGDEIEGLEAELQTLRNSAYLPSERVITIKNTTANPIVLIFTDISLQPYPNPVSLAANGGSIAVRPLKKQGISPNATVLLEGSFTRANFNRISNITGVETTVLNTGFTRAKIIYVEGSGSGEVDIITP